MTDSTKDSDPLADFVDAQATRLWKGYHADRSDAVAELARLRRTVPTGSQVHPSSWELFARGDGFPQELLGHGDEPSPSELAAAATLALFALHQQSQRERRMHVRAADNRLGRAAWQLRGKMDSGGVDRRIQAITRANDIGPALDQLRGLVGLMRSNGVPLDYAQLALDLRAIQSPAGRRGARVRWSRDYYRLGTKTTDHTVDPTDGGDASSDHTPGDPA